MNLEKPEINYSISFYYELQYLSKRWGSTNVSLHSFFEDFSFILNGKSNIFSETTKNLLRNLEVQINQYIKNYKISEIGCIKLLDNKYISILESVLIPLINSAFSDLNSLHIEVEKIEFSVDELSNDYLLRIINSLME